MMLLKRSWQRKKLVGEVTLRRDFLGFDLPSLATERQLPGGVLDRVLDPGRAHQRRRRGTRRGVCCGAGNTGRLDALCPLIRRPRKRVDDLYRLAALLGELVRIMDPLPQGSYGDFQVETLPPPPLPPTGIPGAQPGPTGGRAPARSAAEWAGLRANPPAPRPPRPLPPWVEPPAAPLTAPAATPPPTAAAAPAARAAPRRRDPEEPSGPGSASRPPPLGAPSNRLEQPVAPDAAVAASLVPRAPQVADRAAPDPRPAPSTPATEPPPRLRPAIVSASPRSVEVAPATPAAAPPVAAPAVPPAPVGPAAPRMPRPPEPPVAASARVAAPAGRLLASPSPLAAPVPVRPAPLGRMPIPAAPGPSAPRRIMPAPVGALPPPAPVIAFSVPTLQPLPEAPAPAPPPPATTPGSPTMPHHPRRPQQPHGAWCAAAASSAHWPPTWLRASRHACSVASPVIWRCACHDRVPAPCQVDAGHPLAVGNVAAGLRDAAAGRPLRRRARRCRQAGRSGAAAGGGWCHHAGRGHRARRPAAATLGAPGSGEAGTRRRDRRTSRGLDRRCRSGGGLPRGDAAAWSRSGRCCGRAMPWRCRMDAVPG